MSVGKPVPIPFPISSFPGANPQESGGRLINCYAEQLPDGGPAKYVLRRSPGLSQFAATSQSGYRGGLIVNNLSFECWENNASTIDDNGNVTSLGNFPGTKIASIARNQASPTPDVIAVDIDNGAYCLESATVNPATATATIEGSSLIAGNVIDLTFLNEYIDAFPVALSYTILATDTLTTIAAALAALINANSTLAANNISATSSGAILTVDHQGSIGNSTSLTFGIAAGSANLGNETVTFSPTAGNLVSGSATATIGGSVFTYGDIIAITFSNPNISSFPVTINYQIPSGATATSIATALAALINANGVLTTAGVSATSSSAVMTVSQSGGSSASTFLSYSTGKVGNTNVVFNPASGDLAGGTGTYNAFNGTPTVYNGQGNLPQPNSVCFQDGYFFFTTASGECYATPINGLALNALTRITVQAKADVELLRGIAFSGVLLLFTTGSCEVWQDVANPAPNFPYGRLAVLEFGLIQPAAIAGFETGFSELLWVAQNYGVHWLTPGSLAPVKVSPPDLDRLIEAQVRAGNTLTAGVYIFSGKKFWTLSSPAWTWEFNLETKKWNERWSLNTVGVQDAWRGVGGHPAFGKWLLGDQQSGTLAWVDVDNYTELGSPQLMRIESGPVKNFPSQIRIARADFEFIVGVGIAVGNFTMIVLGAAAASDGSIELEVNSTSNAKSNDVCAVTGVEGTTEANGNWTIAVVDATHIKLQSSAFQNAYTSGGTAVDLTSPPNAVAPQVAISLSKDGGVSWGNPSLRQLGQQGNSLRQRISVKSMGLSGTQGARWRLDVADPVYCALLGGAQSSDPRWVGT